MTRIVRAIASARSAARFVQYSASAARVGTLTTEIDLWQAWARRPVRPSARGPTRPWPCRRSASGVVPAAPARGRFHRAAPGPTAVVHGEQAGSPPPPPQIRADRAGSERRRRERHRPVGQPWQELLGRAETLDRIVEVRRPPPATSSTPAPWAFASVTPSARTACSRPGTPTEPRAATSSGSRAGPRGVDTARRRARGRRAFATTPCADGPPGRRLRRG